MEDALAAAGDPEEPAVGDPEEVPISSRCSGSCTFTPGACPSCIQRLFSERRARTTYPRPACAPYDSDCGGLSVAKLDCVFSSVAIAIGISWAAVPILGTGTFCEGNGCIRICGHRQF